MRNILEHFHQKQHGFTLIEIIIAVAISGIIISGITASVIQVFDGNTRSSSHMETIQDTENAGFWLNQDILTTQSVSIGETNGFPLKLSRIDWNGVIHQVTYSLSGTKLLRTVISDGVNISQTVVADNVNTSAAATNCTFADDVLTLKITSEVSSASETRIYEISLRVDQF
jgi:prepilin-type N-terminal cleavage/methylation domain-containing protein